MKTKNFFRSIFLSFAVSAIGGHVIFLLIGYHPYFFGFWFCAAILLLIGVVVGIASFIVIVVWAVKRKPFVKIAVAWVILACSYLVPGIYYEAAGSMMALTFAGPNQVVIEGRSLAQECQEQQTPQDCRQLAVNYPTVMKINPQFIWVDEDGVLVIEKLHAFGDSAGFLIYPENQEPLDGNGTIKIRDGLFWFG